MGLRAEPRQEQRELEALEWAVVEALEWAVPIPVQVLLCPHPWLPGVLPQGHLTAPLSVGQAVQNTLIHKFYSWVFTRAKEQCCRVVQVQAPGKFSF